MFSLQQNQIQEGGTHSAQGGGEQCMHMTKCENDKIKKNLISYCTPHIFYMIQIKNE
jgi:hypothetical protein